MTVRPPRRRPLASSLLAPVPSLLDLDLAVVLEVRKAGLLGIETTDLLEAVEARAGSRVNLAAFGLVLLRLRLSRQVGRRLVRREGRPSSLWYPTSGRPHRRARALLLPVRSPFPPLPA